MAGEGDTESRRRLSNALYGNPAAGGLWYKRKTQAQETQTIQVTTSSVQIEFCVRIQAGAGSAER